MHWLIHLDCMQTADNQVKYVSFPEFILESTFLSFNHYTLIRTTFEPNINYKENLEIQFSDSLNNRCWHLCCAHLPNFFMTSSDELLIRSLGLGGSHDECVKSWYRIPAKERKCKAAIFLPDVSKEIESGRWKSLLASVMDSTMLRNVSIFAYWIRLITFSPLHNMLQWHYWFFCSSVIDQKFITHSLS